MFEAHGKKGESESAADNVYEEKKNILWQVISDDLTWRVMEWNRMEEMKFLRSKIGKKSAPKTKFFNLRIRTEFL